MPLTFRDWTATPADLAALARLNSAQYPEAPITPEDVAHSLAATDPARPFLIRFAVRGDHKVGFVESYPAGPAGEFLLELVVCTEATGQGLGTRLLHHAQAWATGQGAGALVMGVREDDPRRPFLERRGFRLAQRLLAWSLDLSDLTVRPTPDGIRCCTLADTPDRLDEVREVLNGGRAALDLPPFDAPAFEENVLRYGQHRPDLIALAAASGAVVGVAVLLAFDDPSSVECAFVAVHPHWQRRGIGRALLCHACRQARSSGTRTVSATGQADLPGVAALLHGSGFTSAPAWLSLRREPVS